MQPTVEPAEDPAPFVFGQVGGRLPDDRALPALRTIRTSGLAAAMPDLRLGDGPVELRLLNYVPGSRATLDARVGNRRFAVKLYADDPAPEAEAYQRLADEGLAQDIGARVPRLLAWERDLRILAISWLEGPSASRLIREGQGARAGKLAASWLHSASRREGSLGPPRSSGHMLYRVGASVGAVSAADPVLGATAKVAARMLVRTQPEKETLQLVNGALYARHILDLGDGPGVIDWQQFGQGPIEVDAGMFLASVSRLALRRAASKDEATQATETFLSGIRGLSETTRLEWYWAAGLLHLAASGLKTGRKREAPRESHALVVEAIRHAESAGGKPIDVSTVGTTPTPAPDSRRGHPTDPTAGEEPDATAVRRVDGRRSG